MKKNNKNKDELLQMGVVECEVSNVVKSTDSNAVGQVVQQTIKIVQLFSGESCKKESATITAVEHKGSAGIINL